MFDAAVSTAAWPPSPDKGSPLSEWRDGRMGWDGGQGGREGAIHLDISDCHQYLITGLRTQLKIPSWLTSTIRLTSRSLCSPIMIKQFNNKD